VIPVNDLPGPAIITQPENNIKVKIGTRLNFSAICFDPDLPYGDKLSFEWLSNISNKFGNKQNLLNMILPVGNHQITLNVYDQLREFCSDSINITIFPVSNQQENITPNQTEPEIPPEENNDTNKTEPDKKKVNESWETSVVFQAFIVVVIAIIILLVFLVVVLKNNIHPFNKLKDKLFSWEKEKNNNSDSKPPPGG
jgi:hypothetical protein